MSHRPRRTEVLRLVAQRLDVHREEDLLAAAQESQEVLHALGDETELVGALLLSWHTRVSAELDSALVPELRDPVRAVEQAWVRAHDAVPGTRALLDQLEARPPSVRLEQQLHRSNLDEQVRMAVAAGLAPVSGVGEDAAAVRAGRTLQARARAAVARETEERDRAEVLSAQAGQQHVPPGEHVAGAPAPGASARFVERLRALVDA